jgi:organic radical activating enzyme
VTTAPTARQAPATPTADTLVVSEVFGPTVQGEGPSCGRRASFVRLGGCNLACSWCDTPYTWDAGRFDLRAQLTRQPVADVAARALKGRPGLVVITGGEPLLHQQQPGWDKLLGLLVAGGAEIEVETNGTIAPDVHTARWVTRFNVSPKLSNTGDPASRRIRPAALAALLAPGKAACKFVCTHEGDVMQAAEVAPAHDIPPRLVWIMPEGTTPERLQQRLARIADPAICAGFNLTTRLHVCTWGDERAR